MYKAFANGSSTNKVNKLNCVKCSPEDLFFTNHAIYFHHLE